MRYFPDEPADGAWSICAVAVMPLLYLAVALVYSANSAPWGSHVDPESAYAMNGLAWAAGYPMIKNDHPGTTTILLAGLVTRAGAFLGGQRDVVEWGLKNYDAMIYAARAAEAVALALSLFAGGLIVRSATRSAFAAALFQVSPFVNFEAIKYDMRLVPESLMITSGILGMALVTKAALDEKAPSVRLGVAQGVTFALGLSSKYLYAPVGVLVVALLRSKRATVAACVTAGLLFFAFNRILNPHVFTSGFRWLVNLATHKGIYGEGESGFVDFNVFWPNLARIIAADPIVVVIFVAGAATALTQSHAPLFRSREPDAAGRVRSFCRTGRRDRKALSAALHACGLDPDRRRDGPDDRAGSQAGARGSPARTFRRQRRALSRDDRLHADRGAR